MQIQITFTSSASRNAFAAKTGYTTADQTTLTAHAALLSLAKSSEVSLLLNKHKQALTNLLLTVITLLG
jgi:hypothetical protein